MKLFFLGVSLFFLNTSQNFGAELSLQSYLDSVKQNDGNAKAALEALEAADLRSREGSLILTPSVFVDGFYSKDKLTSMTQPFVLEENKGLKLGVKHLTPIGLQGEISTGFQEQDFSALAASPFMKTKHQLSLSLSLWRNLFGRESRALRNQIEAGTLASHFLETFKLKQILVTAEVAYWNLALARENLSNQRESLDRAEKLFAFTSKKRRLELSSESDFVQAASALEIRKLKFEMANDEARSAGTSFNRLRSRNAADVEETLEVINEEKALALKEPENIQMRADIKANLEQEKARVAVAQSAMEGAKPKLELFSDFAFQGEAARDQHSQSFKDSSAGKNPAYTVGIRFSTPLQLGWMSEVKSGWQKEKYAAELRSKQKLFDQDQEWENLKLLFKEAKNRLQIATRIERAERKKLKAERSLFDRGRSTTFQVVRSEQDLADSQFSRLQAEAEVINIHAQMKLYE